MTTADMLALHDAGELKGGHWWVHVTDSTPLGNCDVVMLQPCFVRAGSEWADRYPTGTWALQGTYAVRPNTLLHDAPAAWEWEPCLCPWGTPALTKEDTN